MASNRLKPSQGLKQGQRSANVAAQYRLKPAETLSGIETSKLLMYLLTTPRPGGLKPAETLSGIETYML